ncbi:hypothetical protein K1719_046908 [Acacia pycnantha]|nr:hypothetical protein K1719_046908 [Acacia pycnantha]
MGASRFWVLQLQFRQSSSKCAASLNAARMILAAMSIILRKYCVMQSLLYCLDSPELPFLQWQECLAVLVTRLPKDLKNELESKFKEFERISNSQNVDFPAKLLKGILDGLFGQYLGASNHEELHNLIKATVMIQRLKKDVLSQLLVKRRHNFYVRY